MNVLKRLTYHSMKLNRKRTLVTIVGVILATSLITAVANMAESLYATYIVYEKKGSGDYHYRFGGVDAQDLKYFRENRLVEKYGIRQILGLAPCKESKNESKPYYVIYAMNEEGFTANMQEVEAGRFPQSEDEIAISKEVKRFGGVDIKLGDLLELDVGDRYFEGEKLREISNYEEGEEFCPRQKKTYKVVGILKETGALEIATSPCFPAITYLPEETAKGKLVVYATYTKEGLKEVCQTTAGLLGIPQQEYTTMTNLDEQQLSKLGAIASSVSVHRKLVRLERFALEDGLARMLVLLSAFAMGIVIASSVFCIRNSFAISLTEKLKLYGMLSSVGATRKQLRGMVFQEAVCLGCIGIPLGLFFGMAATLAIVLIMSGLMEQAMGVALVYQPSYGAMALGVALSIVILYLSALQAAMRAGRISPIMAIRGNESLCLGRRERKRLEKADRKLGKPDLMARFYKKLFGVGGLVAYRNLKRSRGKYRTTVIAIVVSLSMFISLSSLIHMGLESSRLTFQDIPWQVRVSLDWFGGQEQEAYEEAVKLTKLDGVIKAEACKRLGVLYVPSEQVPFTEKYEEDREEAGIRERTEEMFYLLSMEEEAYRDYCSQLHLDLREVEDQAILLDDYVLYVTSGSGSDRKVYQGYRYRYQQGDVIKGYFDEEGEEPMEIQIAAVASKRPMCVSDQTHMVVLLVSDEWAERHMDDIGAIEVYFQCEDAYALEDAVESQIGPVDYWITNRARTYEESRALLTILGIFLYGFITVVAMIGITNVFNTITTNLELRSREFAMLASVGMTRSQFRRMISLENLIYGGKALFFAVPAGCLLSYGLYSIFKIEFDLPYRVPWESILISIPALYLVLVCILRYSMGKMKRWNLADMMQNENI